MPFTARLPEPLYNQMRTVSFEQRIPFSEMLSVSLAKHLNEGVPVDSSPGLGSLNAREKRVLLVCLDILRNARGRDRTMFDAIIKWWMDKGN